MEAIVKRMSLGYCEVQPSPGRRCGCRVWATPSGSVCQNGHGGANYELEWHFAICPPDLSKRLVAPSDRDETQGTGTLPLPSALVMNSEIEKMLAEPAGVKSGGSWFDAMTWMIQGDRIARKGWNGEGMFVVFVPAKILSWKCRTEENRRLLGMPEKNIPIAARYDLLTAQGTLSCGWRPTPVDLMASDWYVVTI